MPMNPQDQDDQDSPSFFDQLKQKMAQVQQYNSDPDKQKAIQDAINTSSGVMGSIQGPGLSALSKLAGVGEQAAAPAAQAIGDAAQSGEMSLADKIKQAALRSQSGNSPYGTVKVLPTAQQAADDLVQQQTQNLPKTFFSDAAEKAAQNGVSASPGDQAAFAAQKAATQNMIQNRNILQMQQAKDPQFQMLKRLLSK